MTDYQATGGARLGMSNASHPLAKLSSSPTSLELSVEPFGNYAFTPDQVVSLEPFGFIPVIAWGVRVVHTRSEYPAHIVFWYLGNRKRVIRGIQDSGFRPNASPVPAITARARATRIATLALFALLGTLFAHFVGHPWSCS